MIAGIRHSLIAGCALLGSLCVVSPVSAAPESVLLKQVVAEAYEQFKGNSSGNNAQYIPALASADPDRFGIVIVTADGRVIQHGDVDDRFAIMSAAKPFTLALLLQQRGTKFVMEKIGVEPTGLPFNSLQGIDRSAGEPLNPMVNAGAITAVSLLKAEEPEQLWSTILGFYSELAGEDLSLMGDVYRSVSSSNYRNRAIVNLLHLNSWLETDPSTTLDVYNKQSSVGVTARQLAIMGATLTNGGVNPVNGKPVIDPSYVDEVLSVMLLSGFYDESGRWAYTAGIPAKSGVGGGVFAVVPGQMVIVGYSPRLNKSGNSVRATLAIEYIARKLNLSLFRS
jgi:glutaminase